MHLLILKYSIVVHSSMSLEKLIGQLLLLVLPKSYCMSEVISVSQLAWPIVSCYVLVDHGLVYGINIWC